MSTLMGVLSAVEDIMLMMATVAVIMCGAVVLFIM